MGEVTVNLKEFNSSAAWGISPFSSNPGSSKMPPRTKGELLSSKPAALSGSAGALGSQSWVKP